MTAHTTPTPTMTTGEPERAPLKLELALALLIDAYHADRFITTLDALNTYGDTCWHTTAHTLRDRGVTFCQHTHRHAHQNGGTARFQAYQLAPESLETAERLLAFYRRGRGAPPAEDTSASA